MNYCQLNRSSKDTQSLPFLEEDSMILKVTTYWHKSLGWKTEERQLANKPVSYPNGGGYSNLEEMQKKLLQRLKHRKPIKIPTGIQCEGDVGSYQTVELLEA
jgi:hypothetical protein